MLQCILDITAVKVHALVDESCVLLINHLKFITKRERRPTTLKGEEKRELLRTERNHGEGPIETKEGEGIQGRGTRSLIILDTSHGLF